MCPSTMIFFCSVMTFWEFRSSAGLIQHFNVEYSGDLTGKKLSTVFLRYKVDKSFILGNHQIKNIIQGQNIIGVKWESKDPETILKWI